MIALLVIICRQYHYDNGQTCYIFYVEEIQVYKFGHEHVSGGAEGISTVKGYILLGRRCEMVNSY